MLLHHKSAFAISRSYCIPTWFRFRCSNKISFLVIFLQHYQFPLKCLDIVQINSVIMILGFAIQISNDFLNYSITITLQTDVLHDIADWQSDKYVLVNALSVNVPLGILQLLQECVLLLCYYY
jgi:hypothetical protein